MIRLLCAAALFTSSTTLPLRVWSYVGLVIAFLAFAYAIVLITAVPAILAGGPE